MVALELYRTEVLAFKRLTPCSGFPHLIASRTYNVRGTLIEGGESVAEMHFLELIYKVFLDGLSTVNLSCVRHQNRVLRVERDQGGGIVVVVCIVKFFNERDKLLA